MNPPRAVLELFNSVFCAVAGDRLRSATLGLRAKNPLLHKYSECCFVGVRGVRGTCGGRAGRARGTRSVGHTEIAIARTQCTHYPVPLAT